ncbi:hypothetical protein OAG75_00215 [bacterium]|nr:hypothetical protein [bacterium]
MIERLFCSFAPDVASVFAPYPSRFAENYVCWRTGCPGKKGGGTVVHSRPPGEDADQVEEIQGSGFGCLLLRSGVVKKHFFQVPGNHKYYDPHFFDSMPRDWKRLVDWSCICEHRNAVV